MFAVSTVSEKLQRPCFFTFVEDDEQYNEQINTLFRTVHIGFFSTSVQVCTATFAEFSPLLNTLNLK